MIQNIKVVALIEDSNKVLLIKEWSNKKNGYFWNLIKGSFGDHPNETLEDCAKRESEEEAGLKIETENLISCYTSEDGTGMQFNFLAHPTNQSSPKTTNKLEQKNRGEDIVEVKWFDKNTLFKMAPEKFINNRIYKVINDWKKNKKYSFEIMAEWS